jgi:hypothetical protein
VTVDLNPTNVDGEAVWPPAPMTLGQLGLCGHSDDPALSADAARWIPATPPTSRPRVYREAPGRWRCDVPGLDGAAFAPTWSLALNLGRTLADLPARLSSAPGPAQPVTTRELAAKHRSCAAPPPS